jgi:hypothetical protein
MRPEIAFIVYGVHKEAWQDPMGTPFIDEQVVNSSSKRWWMRPPTR